MNLNIDPSLRNSIRSFSWEEQPNNALPYTPNELTQLVDDIATKIIGASNTRDFYNQNLSQSLSLMQTCYLIVQDLDKKEQRSTAAQIEQLSPNAKALLRYSFKQLSSPNYFVQVLPEDLKEITLLFGAKLASDLANKIIPIPATSNSTDSRIEDLKNAVSQLIALKSKYNSDNLSEPYKTFIAQVEFKIQQSLALIEELENPRFPLAS